MNYNKAYPVHFICIITINSVHNGLRGHKFDSCGKSLSNAWKLKFLLAKIALVENCTKPKL